MSNDVALIEETIFAMEPVFAQVSVDKSITFRREAEFAIQQICKSDYAIKIALGNKQAVQDAVANISAIGISLNPARKQAYLVPRDGKICLDISYMGVLDLAVDSGSILWGQAELVYSTDKFKRLGYDKPPKHEYEEFSNARGELVGVYCVVKTADGDYLTTSMTIEEVNEIRDRSSAWKKWIETQSTAKPKKCPWVTDEGEMVKKTVLKRASKTWPRKDRVDKAVHYLNTDGGQGIELHDGADEAKTVAPTLNIVDMLKEIKTTTDMDRLAALRRKGLSAASSTKDKVSYDRIKNAVDSRRAALKHGVTDAADKRQAA